MPVAILPNGDHRDRGAHPAQEGIAGGPGRPMMPHLEHFRLPHRLDQRRLRGKARVSREHRVERAIGDPQDHRVLIGRQVGLDPGLGGVQDRQDHRIQRHGIAGAAGAPRRPNLIHRSLELEIQRGPQRLTRLDHQVGRQRAGQGRNPAQVIGVAVTGDQKIQRPNPVPAEKRQHHAPPGIAGRRSRTAIHHGPAPARGAEHDGVPLAHVQHVEVELLPALTRGQRGDDDAGPRPGQEKGRAAQAERAQVGPPLADPDRRSQCQDPRDGKGRAGEAADLAARHR